MTSVDEAVQEGSFPAEGEAPEANAAMRAWARKSLTSTALTALKPVTQRARAAGQDAARIANSKDSLIHSQPPTFHQVWRHHHDCAGHYEAALLRYPRLAWGYFHLLVIKPLLNGAEWVTESPARFFVTAAVLTIIWLFA